MNLQINSQDRLAACLFATLRVGVTTRVMRPDKESFLALERQKWADGSYLVSQEKLSGSPVAASKKEDKNSSTSSG
jgi:hypothetical protein